MRLLYINTLRKIFLNNYWLWEYYETFGINDIGCMHGRYSRM